MKKPIQKIPFKIAHMDGLGQGVSKILDKPTFVSKTLPDEEGLATLIGQKKQVSFAQLESPHDLQHRSPLRIASECPHFDHCPGCHFLHTDYATELQFKQNALNRELKKLKVETPTPIHHPSSERYAYRNRITLHYKNSQGQIGIFSGVSNDIVPISQCRLPVPEIQNLVRELYQSQEWQKLVRQEEGHIEIYKHPTSGLQTSVDRPYAHLGFSQVHQTMNLELTDWIANKASSINLQNSNLILDLFGGDGNLTRKINFSERIYVVDKYSSNNLPISNNTSQHFFPCDLYSNVGLAQLRQSLTKKFQSLPLGLMIIDPPRSGFTLTALLANDWKPSNIFYVSCASDTLMRDIKDLFPLYAISDIHLFDMFPGTFHFETVIHLQLSK